MRQQEVFKKIGNILQELTEQYDYLKNYEEPIDDLELELFAANAHFLGDHLEILRKLSANTAAANMRRQTPEFAQQQAVIPPIADDAPAAAPVTTLPSIMPVIGVFHADTSEEANEESTAHNEPDLAIGNDDLVYDESENFTREHHDEPDADQQRTPIMLTTEDDHSDTSAGINLGQSGGADSFSYVRSEEPATIRHNLELDEADTFSDEDNQPENESVSEALAELEIAPEPKAEEHYVAIQHDEPVAVQPERPLTLNERMSAQISSHNTHAPAAITDLKAAININDKMLFVRDLFNGYSLAYSEAIEILNRFNNLEDAQRFLTNNYVNKNNWADKPDTSQRFHSLLKRRFA